MRVRMSGSDGIEPHGSGHASCSLSCSVKARLSTHVILPLALLLDEASRAEAGGGALQIPKYTFRSPLRLAHTEGWSPLTPVEHADVDPDVRLLLFSQSGCDERPS